MNLRERIVQEASILFFNSGIKSMTMSEIANHLGISKRTLYEVFEDKEDLLEECIDRHMKKMNEELNSLFANSENVISSMMLIYKKHLSDMHGANKFVLRDLKKYHPRLYRKLECEQEDRVDLFIPLFQRGIEQGLIRDDLNIEICLLLIKAQFKMAMEREYPSVQKYSMNEFVRTIILNFVRGISTPAGYEVIEEIVKKLNSNNDNNI